MGGNSKRGSWPQRPTPEDRADGERRREIAQAAAVLAVELTGCVAGSEDHVDVTRRLLRFARLVEASVRPGQQRKASSRRMTSADMSTHISEVIEQVMGRIVLGLRPDGRGDG